MCVRACARACVRACVCVRVCVRACSSIRIGAYEPIKDAIRCVGAACCRMNRRSPRCSRSIASRIRHALEPRPCGRVLNSVLVCVWGRARVCVCVCACACVRVCVCSVAAAMTDSGITGTDNLVQKVASGALSGAVGASIASPTDLVKVRQRVVPTATTLPPPQHRHCSLGRYHDRHRCHYRYHHPLPTLYPQPGPQTRYFDVPYRWYHHYVV